MSEKQTSPDNVENSDNTDDSSASLSQPDTDDSHPFLESEVPTLQDFWVVILPPTFCESKACFCF